MQPDTLVVFLFYAYCVIAMHEYKKWPDILTAMFWFIPMAMRIAGAILEWQEEKEVKAAINKRHP